MPAIRDHWQALILFPLLAFLWVGDSLVLNRDLSAFDVILRLPNWSAEYEYLGVQELILSDSPQAHYPERELKWGTMAEGHRLNYNPYIFSGLEDSGQGVGGLVTSPFQFFMEVDEAIDWSTWLRLAIAGIFMYGFLIGVGASRLASMFGGVLWAFNMHQIVWLELPQHLATQLWIPLIFYLNYRILKQGFSKARIAGLLVSNLFFYTGGYIQIVLYTYMCIGIFNTIYLTSVSNMRLKERLWNWTGIHLIFIFFAAFLLPKVMLDGELIQDGLRGAQTFRAGLGDASHDLSAVIALFKNVLPDIADFKRLYTPDYLGGIWNIKYHGPGSLVEYGAYFGLISLILLPLALVHLVNREKRPLILGLLAIIAFSFGMIHRDPLLKELVNIVPLAGLGSYGRFITLALFAMSSLAALGFHYLEKNQRSSVIKVFAAITLFLMMAPWLLRFVDGSINPAGFLYSLYISLGLLVLLAIISRFKLKNMLVVSLLAITIVDLLVSTRGFNPRMPDERNFPLTKTLEYILEDDSDFRVATLSRTNIYPPNMLQYYHIPTVSGYWVTVPRRYLGFIKQVYGDSHVTTNGMLFLFHGNLNVLRGLGTKYIVSDREIDDPMIREIPGLSEKTWLYEFIEPLPRLHCASDLSVFENEKKLVDAMSGLYQTQDRPLALIDQGRKNKTLTDNCRVEAIETRINNVELSIQSDQPSYVMVPYSRSRHWHATINGEAAELIDANYALMAIPIDAGTSEIKIYYQNSLNLWFVAAQILLGLIVILLALSSPQKGYRRNALIILALIVIITAALEVPIFRNDNIAEREPGEYAARR